MAVELRARVGASKFKSLRQLARDYCGGTLAGAMFCDIFMACCRPIEHAEALVLLRAMAATLPNKNKRAVLLAAAATVDAPQATTVPPPVSAPKAWNRVVSATPARDSVAVTVPWRRRQRLPRRAVPTVATETAAGTPQRAILPARPAVLQTSTAATREGSSVATVGSVCAGDAVQKEVMGEFGMLGELPTEMLRAVLSRATDTSLGVLAQCCRRGRAAVTRHTGWRRRYRRRFGKHAAASVADEVPLTSWYIQYGLRALNSCVECSVKTRHVFAPLGVRLCPDCEPKTERFRLVPREELPPSIAAADLHVLPHFDGTNPKMTLYVLAAARKLARSKTEEQARQDALSGRRRTRRIAGMGTQRRQLVSATGWFGASGLVLTDYY